jgi:hypothetical protein
MIDAKTARTLVEESDTLMVKYLEDLGNLIEREAKLGKRHVFPANSGLQFRSIYDVAHEDCRASEMNGLQKLIKARLKLLGFDMCLEKQKVQIGGGLGWMDDEVRHEFHASIKISW